MSEAAKDPAVARMDDRESLIQDVLDGFNFERVHIAMTALDWQWVERDGPVLSTARQSVPSILRLKAMALHLLREAINHKTTGSGGFEAKYYPKVADEPEYFSLKFVLCSYDTYDD